MKRQCRLVTIAKQEPLPMPKGSRTHNPRQVALAAVNKGKKYPYASTRQNTRCRVDPRCDTCFGPTPCADHPIAIAAE